MLRFFRFFLGYVRIEIRGAYPHRFFNLCTKRGIAIWAIDCDENGRYQFNLLVRDYFLLAPIARKSKMKVVLKKKQGLPFCLKKWKKRRGFLLGILLCIGSLILLSRFIWDIELDGGSMLTQDVLLQFLKEEQIEYGTFIRDINVDEVEKDLRERFPYVVWTSLKIKGTKLLIQVKENTQLMPEISEDQRTFQASDLIATVDGTIVSIVTRCGMPQVKVGDEIKKGDKLVSGVVPIINDDETIRDYMQVQSDADIYVRTKYQYRNAIPIRSMKKQYTGKNKNIFYIKFKNQSFVTAAPPDFLYYDVLTNIKQLRLMNDFYLPVYWGTIEYEEYRQKEYAYSIEELKEMLSREFVNFCESLQQKGIQIVSNDVKIKKNMDKIWMEGNVVVDVKDGDSFASPYLSNDS